MSQETWTTQTGETLLIDDMSESHVRNALKYIARLLAQNAIFVQEKPKPISYKKDLLEWGNKRFQEEAWQAEFDEHWERLLD